MATSKFFTGLIPKCNNVTGAPNQVFIFAENFTNDKAAVKLVQTKTITALDTVTPGSTVLQYIFDPRIHRNLSGKPATIIGNASNKQGEFSLVKIELASFHQFPYLAPKKNFDP